MKHIHIGAAILVFCALVLNGCSGLFLEKPQLNPEQGTFSPDIPGGFGTIRVSFSLGAARTVMPEPVELDVLYLEYWFSKDGEEEERKDPSGDIFILEPGTYDLTVKGFLTNAQGPLVTQGEAAASFTIVAGTAGGTVDVTLRPIASGEGTGALDFGLQYPAGVTVASLVLTRIGGTESYNLLNPAPSITTTTLSGSRSNIPVGYYLLQAGLINSAGQYAGKTEVVHIYQNLAAQTALAGYTFTNADFSAYRVINTNDAGAGSLRQAITDINTMTGVTPVIQISLPPGSVIELQSKLPDITKNLTIEGNGVTLTRAASASWPNYSHLLRIYSDTAVVTVRRMHFKDGFSYGQDGGAIQNSGILTLESCIFNNNLISYPYASGGAIYSYNTLTIRGCTFYGNTAEYRGGAIGFSASGKTLTLEGNLFYKNTDVYRRPVVYVSDGAVSASYNVVDVAFGTGDNQCGWVQGTGDTLVSTLPVSPLTFRLPNGSGAAGKLPSTRPTGYPTTDFYGNPISGGGAAGAVQASTVHGSGYYYLDLTVNNSQLGTVEVSPLPDEDGLVPASSTFTVTPVSGYDFYWLVNGVTINTTTPTILTDHTQMRAVFGRPVTVDNFTDEAGSESTPGTLRYALTNAQEGDIITFTGVTPGSTVIALQSVLPDVTQDLVIKGNGVTLDGNDTYQLMRVLEPAVVKISGVHFKNGLASSSGGGIYNTGILTLKSCVFSANHANSSGGAVYSTNTLTLLGCTFYNNTDYTTVDLYLRYAAIKTLTMAGNLFYGNTVGTGRLVWVSYGTINASYNVVDVAAYGTSVNQTGWTAGTGDTTLTDLSISGAPFDTTTFAPVSGLQSVLPSAPADFPETDFYGATRTFPGAPGAVKQAP